MKLEAGKTYLDRCGLMVKIILHDTNDLRPYLGDNDCRYQADGRFSYLKKDTEWDLITEEK